MESSYGMTRYSVKNLCEIICRRRYWLAVFAVLFAFGVSILYWHNFYSSYRVSATFIPASQQTEATDASGSAGVYSVIVSQSFIKHEEVLQAVINSVDFDLAYGDLEEAVSADIDSSGVAVTVHVDWPDQAQAYKILDALKANISFAITHSAKAGTIRWLDSAESSGGHALAGRTQTYVVFLGGALLGLVVGAAFSLLLGMMDKRIYDLENVRYDGDVRVLGYIRRSSEIQTEQFGRSYRQLTAVALYLKMLMESQDQKLVMCISPTAKCGTSTIITKIAQILSGMHMKVLIAMIRTDTPDHLVAAEPEITPLSPGVDRCVLSWDDKEGDPAYTGPLTSLISSAQKDYGFVLVDCPALLQNIQMSLFAGGMDTTMLICGYGITTQEELHSAVALLSRTEEKPIYCVWNFVSSKYHNTYPSAETRIGRRKGYDESHRSLGADVHL